MEQSTITLVVGLAGISSTLIVSGMGLYYTAKSRPAALRQALFSKQREMVVEIVHLQSRIRLFATHFLSKKARISKKLGEISGNTLNSSLR
ncbi:MAG: hypothetical protein WC782_09450 [Methylococcaceae bacterium]|jgi:hypothetical protein